MLQPAAGKVEFLGSRIEGLQSHAIVELGMSHIPEGRKLFPDMSVHENLEMGAYPKRVWERKQETLAEVYQLFPLLKARKGQLAGTLSGEGEFTASSLLFGHRACLASSIQILENIRDQTNAK